MNRFILHPSSFRQQGIEVMGEEGKQLVESLCRQQQQAWLAGRPISAECLFERYPQLQADTEAVLELIYNEILLRQQAGESPSLEDYQRRFPQWAARLELLFEVHAVLGEETLTPKDRPLTAAKA